MPQRWAPRMDVYEKDGDLVIKADLPGLKKEDVQVEIVEGDLVIRGESSQEREVNEENYHRMERSFGSFHRRIPLGSDIDPDRIRAQMTDGVLEVRVPRPAERKPSAKRVQIS
jgi:HSP20 family protein